MGKPRRENDTRRTVGSHQEMMSAFGRAAGWTRYSDKGRDFAIRANAEEQTLGSNHPHDVFIPGHSTAVKYSTGEAVNTAMSSVDRKTPSAADLAEKYRKTIG